MKLMRRINRLADRLDPDGADTVPDSPDSGPDVQDTAPADVPDSSDTPRTPPQGGARLPDWRAPKRPLTDPPTAPAPAAEAPAADLDDEDQADDVAELTDDEDEAPRRGRLTDWWRNTPTTPTRTDPAPDPLSDLDPHSVGPVDNPLPVVKEPARAGIRATFARARKADPRDDNRRWRIVAFNAAAAAPGFALGIGPAFASALQAAEQSAPFMLATGFAIATGTAAVFLMRHPAVRVVLSRFPLIQLGCILGAAEIGRRLAPAGLGWLDTHGTPWGLPPSAVALLVTTGTLCGGLYYLLDRPARHLHWTVRLVVRIPLASAIVSAALNTTSHALT